MNSETGSQPRRSTTAKVNLGSHLAGLIALCVVVAVCAYSWKAYREWKRQVADSNAEVVTNIGSYLPQVFASFSETVRSEAPLTPDIVYSGKDSRIIGFYEQTTSRLVEADKISWLVLAQTKSGHYFTVGYELCQECADDQRGVNRVRRDEWHVRPMSVEDAKDWLYRAGLRKEFRAEFGQDAPPKSVQG